MNVQTHVVYFDGMSGSGKTTLITKLANEIEGQGKTCVVLKEKQFEPFKQTVLEWNLRTDTSSYSYDDIVRFARARGETHRRHLNPLLGQVHYLIFDRCFFMSAAYQSSMICSMDQIISLNLAMGALIPHKSVICICPSRTAVMRISTRNRPHYQFPSGYSSILDFSTRSRKLYLRLARVDRSVFLLDTAADETTVYLSLQRYLQGNVQF